jgi:nicotinate-nucleotide pyrophosphorylase (carboxylating)
LSALGLVDPARILEQWLAEDAPYLDLATEAMGLRGVKAEMRVAAKTGGVAACTLLVADALRGLGLEAEALRPDGSPFSPGDTVLVARGEAPRLLTLERTVLNALIYASGVATAARRMLEAARRANPRVRLAATRKTPPGSRLCGKLAFAAAGCDTHRWGLSDAVIVKDSHVELVGGLREALSRALSRRSFAHIVEVEVSSPEQAVEAARLGADAVMLDNMSPSEACRAVELLEQEGLRGRVIVEASGGITPWNIASYAACGVDVISTSYPLLHPDPVDLSAEMRRIGG